jgi:hypothetical protein
MQLCRNPLTPVVALKHFMWKSCSLDVQLTSAAFSGCHRPVGNSNIYISEHTLQPFRLILEVTLVEMTSCISVVLEMLITPQLVKTQEPGLRSACCDYATGWMIRGSNTGRGFSLLQNVQTGSGTHQAFSLMGTAVMWPGREAQHLPPSSAEVKNEWSCTFTLPYMPSWRGQGQLYFFVLPVQVITF